MPALAPEQEVALHQSILETERTVMYTLEFDVGVVHLDHALHVVGMNDYARRSLPVDDKLPFGKIVTDFHPEAAKAKVMPRALAPSHQGGQER